MRPLPAIGPMDRHFRFLKGDFFDDVYLQQNAFDKADESSSAERQKHVFGLVVQVMKQSFEFKDKESARKFFQELRQLFINWNSSEFQSDDFKRIENDLQEKLKIKD